MCEFAMVLSHMSVNEDR